MRWSPAQSLVGRAIWPSTPANRPSVAERLAAALEVKLLLGFETEAGDGELVAVQQGASAWRVQSITEHPTLG